MAALDDAVAAGPDPDHHVAAKTFDQRHALAAACRGQVNRGSGAGFRREPLQDLLDQGQVLFDFTYANPDAGVHVALIQHRYVEFQRIVRRIAGSAERVEVAAGGAADVAPAAELPCQGRRQDAGPDGPVL